MIPLSKDVGRLLVTSFDQKKNVLFVKHSCIHHTCFDGFENTQVPTTLIEWSHRKDTDIFRKLRHSGYLKRTTLGQNVFVKTHHVAPWTQKWLEILSNVSSASETMTFLFFQKVHRHRRVGGARHRGRHHRRNRRHLVRRRRRRQRRRTERQSDQAGGGPRRLLPDKRLQRVLGLQQWDSMDWPGLDNT